MDIFDAILESDTDLINAILDADPSLINKAGSDGLTPLQFACLHVPDWGGTFVGIFKELIRRGANVNARTETGLTPLWFACNYVRPDWDEDDDFPRDEEGDPRPGPDPNIAANGIAPLHLAVVNGDVGLAKLLVRMGANVNAAIESTEHLYDGRLLLVDNHCGVPVKLGDTPSSLCSNSRSRMEQILHQKGAVDGTSAS
jgi:ankyrin repeat protein